MTREPYRNLVRLRAHPKKIRIGVRRHGDLWYVRIGRRDETGYIVGVERVHRSPTRALVLALREAERMEIPGIDLGMGWACEHPQGDHRAQ